MPTYRQPFLKGKLILFFNVKFPEEGWIEKSKLVKLEKILPPRSEVMVPDDGEECTLVKFEPENRSHRRRGGPEAYDDDNDEDGPGPRVQCASH